MCVVVASTCCSKKKKQDQKVLHDAELLKQAHRLLRLHQHDRPNCKKKLLVTHYRVLLQDVGAGDEIRWVVDGKTVFTKRPDLVQAYWSRHTDLAPGRFITHSRTYPTSI